MRTARFRVAASLELPTACGRSPSPALVAAFPLAVLVAVASLAGICLPSTYGRETVNWAEQGIGLSVPYPWDRSGKVGGVFLLLIAALFTAAWLADVIPALAKGTVPKTIVDSGLPTNPVYVMDLSIVVPVHFIAGIALLHRRSLGFTLAPVVLAFDVIMALSIAGIMFVMRIRGVETSAALTVRMALVSGASAVVLEQLMRKVVQRGPVLS